MKLTDGLIRLPLALYDELLAFTLSWCFADVTNAIEQRFADEPETLARAQRILQASASSYNIALTSAQLARVKSSRSITKTFGLNDKLYGQAQSLSVKLKLILDPKKRFNSANAMYQDDGTFISISLYNLKLTGHAILSSPHPIGALKDMLQRIPKLEATLKHELTHLVQYKWLASKHTAQISKGYELSDLTSSLDKHTLSPLEFDPLIKTSLGELKRLEAKYGRKPGYSKHELIGAYVCSEPPPAWMSLSDISDLFGTLKSRAPTKWRKAIKLFMAEL